MSYILGYVYILIGMFQDDPLSALDAHVGRHVLEEAILKRLVKRKKTVVLVTHHVQYLPHASQVGHVGFIFVCVFVRM